MKTYLSLFNDAVEVEVDISYDAYYQPEKISGPPEDCYPSEGELEITGYRVLSIHEHADDHPPITDMAIKEAISEADERLQDECWEDYHGSEYE